MRKSRGGCTRSSTARPCARPVQGAGNSALWRRRRTPCTARTPGSSQAAEPCTRSLARRLCRTGSSAATRWRAFRRSSTGTTRAREERRARRAPRWWRRCASGAKTRRAPREARSWASRCASAGSSLSRRMASGFSGAPSTTRRAFWRWLQNRRGARRATPRGGTLGLGGSRSTSGCSARSRRSPGRPRRRTRRRRRRRSSARTTTPTTARRRPRPPRRRNPRELPRRARPPRRGAAVWLSPPPRERRRTPETRT
mmetsp:Transcript_7860/g.33434  ORF Transcript_7860/g.33434 Transcript_7860/m.33434 type:complete len:255 (-) Transcript_7860:192-956(-)